MSTSGSHGRVRSHRRLGTPQTRARTRAGTARPPSPRGRRARSPRRAPPRADGRETAPPAVAPRRSRKNGLIPRITTGTKPVCPETRPLGWSTSLGRPPTLAPPLPTPMYLQACHSPVQGRWASEPDHGSADVDRSDAGGRTGLDGPAARAAGLRRDVRRGDVRGRVRRGARLAGAGAVRPDGPGGVLPREGRLHPRGQAHLLGLRGAVPSASSTRWRTTSASASGAASPNGSAAACAAPPSDRATTARRGGTACSESGFGCTPRTEATFGASACAQLRPRRRPRRPARC
jgi:hypothetical protein